MFIPKNHSYNNTKFKFLVIEDDESGQEVLKLALNHLFNCEVYLAATGEDGIKTAGNHCFDLIFLNIGLPGIDGIRAAEIIRQRQPQGKRTPIIANSADHKQEQRCLEAGMDAFLAKPFSISQLQEVIKKFGIQSKEWY